MNNDAPMSESFWRREIENMLKAVLFAGVSSARVSDSVGAVDFEIGYITALRAVALAFDLNIEPAVQTKIMQLGRDMKELGK